MTTAALNLVNDVDLPAPTRPPADLLTSELVHELHAGRIDPASLDTVTRQRCVEHLTTDGFTCGEVATLMRICERTVRRDREAIRRDQALAPGLTLGDEMLGELQRITQRSIERLTRLTRDPGASIYVRLRAEEAIVRQYQRLIDTIRHLKYFEDGQARLDHARKSDPQKFQRLRAEIEAAQKGFFGGARTHDGEMSGEAG